ncbi:hypothetical protein HGRIS_014431 [Hohenbuehelia grisea]|uniref:Haloacid dehalogenase n=1 Tax=Hohenbuehelia grisea TaxID=104357 RepID=A0ABR3JTH9_9AGAR
MSNIKQAGALIFDVYGTVVDWRTTVISELANLADKCGLGSPDDVEWEEFANEWRDGYMRATQRLGRDGASGARNTDELHREILDQLLESPKWGHLSDLWDDHERKEVVMIWHQLEGWPDTHDGLRRLKEDRILATLSSAHVRLLVDMAKHAHLPWDVIFSTELFNSFKPDPKVYLGAAHHLSLPPNRCIMVAAHIFDLRAAASLGMYTVYVRRPNEDVVNPASVKCKADGGEVDIVVDSLIELADILADTKLKDEGV